MSEGIKPCRPNIDNAPQLALHLIVDKYATHKHSVVLTWLEEHPRIHLHFTPTGSSWLTLVERFFRQLTDDVVREGSLNSVGKLITAINVHLAHLNFKPTRTAGRRKAR